MTNRKRMSDDDLIKYFVDFFEKLHGACLGHKRIARLSNISIYEETINGEKINFYLFYGSGEEQMKMFEVESVAYCTFREGSSTFTVKFSDGIENFNCKFGYIIHIDQIVEAFALSDRSGGAVKWFSTQIWSHEIRHEMQLIHGLNLVQYRTSFPEVEVSTRHNVNWDDVKKSMQSLYEGYDKKERSLEYLARELDAIITSYVALAEWHRKVSRKTKMHMLAEIITK